MKISRDKVNHLSSLIINDFRERDELDYRKDLNDIRLEIARVILDHLKVDDDADTHSRKTLASYTAKKLREGTDEWDILYEKHYNEFMAKHGLQ